jgi:hypothetical protein
MLRRHCLSGNRPIIAPGHFFWTQVIDFFMVSYCRYFIDSWKSMNKLQDGTRPLQYRVLNPTSNSIVYHWLNSVANKTHFTVEHLYAHFHSGWDLIEYLVDSTSSNTPGHDGDNFHSS